MIYYFSDGHRCDWCIGLVRRDCKIMSRCVKTGNRLDDQSPKPIVRKQYED